MAPPTLRPFLPGFFFGGFNGLTWMIALGTPMVLLAEHLGASTLQVGLASSFVFLLLPVQVLATASLSRLGCKRQMMLGWGLRALFLLVPLGLALAAPPRPAPWMANLLVASVFGFCAFRAFGSAAHLPWFASILPLEIRGRFFATDGSVTSLVGVATLLACAALFAEHPGWPAFAAVYGIALVGSAGALASLSRLPDAPRPRPEPLASLPREARRLCLAPGPFRHYLGISILSASVAAALGPFGVYYLKVEAQLASGSILTYSAAQFAGSIAGSFAIRRAVDRVSLRRFFQLALAFAAAVHGFWLALVTGAALLPLLHGIFFVYGVSISISNTVHFTYLASLGRDDERALMVAVFTAAFGFYSGLVPILWGLVLRGAGAEPSMHVGAFAALFALGLALDAVLFPLYARLQDPRKTPLNEPAARG
jgi:MFS family permease